MIVSESRRTANQRNAQRSTGPKTPEGKEKSSANAIKHGLCSSKLVSENLELLQQRSLELFCALKPQNNWQTWLVDSMAVISLRVDRVVRMERRAHDFKALKAELCWEDDRRQQAVRIGARISEDPADVVETLRRTPQGCEWLMSRWAMLAYAAESVRPWTPDQIVVAFDLLGTPREFRQGQEPGVSIDFEGKGPDIAATQVAVARREIAELRERRELADEIDEVAQALAMASLNIQEESDPEIKNLRRYEGTLHNRFRWYMKQFETKHTNKFEPSLLNNWKGETEKTDESKVETPAEPAPDLGVNKLVDPEPEPEIDADDEGPTILDSRVEKKLRKAESRRQSRNRKAERLRA